MQLRRVLWWSYSGFQFLSGLGIWALFFLTGAAGAFVFRVQRYDLAGTVFQPTPWLMLSVLALFAVTALYNKFVMASSYFISFDIAFCFVAFFLVGPAAGTALAVVAIGIDHVLRSRKGSKPAKQFHLFLDNAGNRMLRFAGLFLTFKVFGTAFPPDNSLRDGAAFLSAVAVYFLINNLFFLPSEYFKEGDFGKFWKDAFTLDIFHSASILVLGYLLTLVALDRGTGLLVFLLFSIFVVGMSWILNRREEARSELKQRLEDLTVLSKVGAEASSSLDVMPMVESFSRKLVEGLEADGIGVVFYHRYAATLYLVQVEGEKSRSTYLPEEKRFQYDQMPLSEASTRLGQRLYEFLQPLETAPFKIPESVYGIPLLHGGEPYGGMVVYADRPGAGFERRRDLLQTCAHSLMVGLENCFLHLQAIQDPLTGLYNRSYMIYRLEEELAYSSRHQAPFALLMMDLDDFKRLNDKLGHSMGDRTLRRMGEIMRGGLRREDVPARYGGDEFIILLVNCDENAAVEKAENLRKALADKALPEIREQGLQVSCSTGVLTSRQLKGEHDIPTILRRLDNALYEAKRSGKNRTVLGS
ncbi:MAG: GGDEF domain-containing protein [Acidobacteriota bacterium]